MRSNQKSADMERLYRMSIDPWGNRSRGLYKVLLKPIVHEVCEHIESSRIIWCDLGCGGANVLDGIIAAIKDIPGRTVELRGVDISETALGYIKSNEVYGEPHNFVLMDLEEYVHDPSGPPPIWSNVDVVSMIDVLYLFGEKRDWRTTFKEIWKGVTGGTLVIVADSLIPYQYRDHLKTYPDAELLSEYTDYSMPVAVELGSRSWTRWFKVRIYRKIGGCQDEVHIGGQKLVGSSFIQKASQIQASHKTH